MLSLLMDNSFLKETTSLSMEPCYIKEKRLLVLGLEIFNESHLLEEEVFIAEKKE